MKWMKMGDLVIQKSGMRDGPFGSNLKTVHFVDSGVQVIRTQNIKPNRYVHQSVAFITEEKAEELNRYDFKPGDLVNTKLGKIPGAACVIPKAIGSGIIPADVVRFRGDPKIINHKYLAFFLNSEYCRTRLFRYTKGSTRQRVNLSSLREINVPVFNVRKQREIVAELSKILLLQDEILGLHDISETLFKSSIQLFIDGVEKYAE